MKVRSDYIVGENYVLAVDCGTQSIRGIIFDKKGNIIESEKQEFKPYFSLQAGWAEQNADVYWNNLCKVTGKLKEKNPDALNNVISVVISTLRDSGVCVDKEGNPLRPSIMWLDQRMAKCRAPLSKTHRTMFLAVGMTRTINITRKQAKSNWIKENEPEIWEKTYKFLQISGYLNFKLTGNFKDSSACQIGHIPFNYKKFKWEESSSSWRWDVFGIEPDKLCEIVSPGEILGYITEESSEATGLKKGLKILAGASDKGCETLGCGCIKEGCASISFGTTATAQITTDKWIEPLKFMPSYPAAVPEKYNPEIQIYRGYWMISWFKKEFAEKEVEQSKNMNISAEELLNKRLSEIPPGSQGLILQPYWSPHVTKPDAKGSIIGFSDVHTRIHIYRAIIEGINYGLMNGIEKLEKKSGIPVNTIMVSGGGSQSDAICQITADMFGRPVKRIHTHEASSLGAAIIGFVSEGLYKNYDDAVENMVHYEKQFFPDYESNRIYKALYSKVYKKLDTKLKFLYLHIRMIINYPEW